MSNVVQCCLYQSEVLTIIHVYKANLHFAMVVTRRMFKKSLGRREKHCKPSEVLKDKMASASRTHVPYVKDEEEDENELNNSGRVIFSQRCGVFNKTFNLVLNVKSETKSEKIREKEFDLALDVAQCELRRIEFRIEVIK
jgi:hypothetical protein